MEPQIGDLQRKLSLLRWPLSGSMFFVLECTAWVSRARLPGVLSSRFWVGASFCDASGIALRL